MDNDDQFNRSLDELLKQILADSESSPEPVQEPDDDELLDWITSEVDPDVQVYIQHEVNKAIGKLIPILHRHVTASLQASSEQISGQVQQVTTTYSQRMAQGVEELRAEINKLQRTGRWLTWIIVISWVLLLGMLFVGR